MKYWFTTHWPPRIDEPEGHLPHGVWILDSMTAVAAGMASGDPVFIYEAGSGRTEIKHYADGTIRENPCRQGRTGVLLLAEITDKPTEIPNSKPTNYTDGSQRWWRYHAPTKAVNSGGFIPSVKVIPLLGYKAGYTMRGFGGGSGLKKLDKATYELLLGKFIDSSVQDEQRVIQAASTAFVRPSGGEGPTHLALKKYIAANPADALNEPGLVLWEEEWSFITGDRVDLVLKDRFGRFVVVEVEVDCESTELAGPLQCMKYRAMLAYFFERRESEVRSKLVAHFIDPNLRQTCRRYGIECYVVGRGLINRP